MLKFGVVVFPGSNCDHDAYHVVGKVIHQDARFIWHKEDRLGNVDVVIVPGGFSYGDYLRVGAIARFSPIMKDVVRFAREGGIVMGVCNGFQILCESGLLPGVLLRNANLRFVCKDVFLRVERTDTPFTQAMTEGELLEIPVAHGDGNYFASEEELDRLEANHQVVFRYADASGALTGDANPNGSMRNIAGIVNEERNVLGMMPHPERCAEQQVGSGDGLKIFESLMAHAGMALSVTS